jgi:hypothetical protein
MSPRWATSAHSWQCPPNRSRSPFGQESFRRRGANPSQGMATREAALPLKTGLNSEGEQIMGPKQHTGRDPAPRRWPSVHGTFADTRWQGRAGSPI